MNQPLLFFKKYMHDPKYMGSVVPSSRFLTKRMISAVHWEQIQTVVELGSGTGALTREIAKRVAPQAQVVLFEKDEQMRESLQREFPKWTCRENALQLSDYLKTDGVNGVDCIFSCLPFYNFPSDMRLEMIRQCVDALKPGGQLIAFQYSLQMKRMLSEHFEIESISLELLNFPPAFVYVCRKEA
ncbi:Phospholipid N-methyltransferase [Paenibacillaceae bacterium GAS479]|nr:Phospholipid N-methyltransferase [Paenibacillaceae bacterium GAS479]